MKNEETNEEKKEEKKNNNNCLVLAALIVVTLILSWGFWLKKEDNGKSRYQNLMDMMGLGQTKVIMIHQ